MRAGGCTLQQALTPDATELVKQSVSLARRRGHAQVTPLHVASTMLSSAVGLLRTACLQSHSHPLQCKALELCFNVALNRLPASTNTMLGGTHHHHHHHQQQQQQHLPTLSNALGAAFKRAQAHQRRGTIETQQQPLLGVKIEIEQLCISILDDPSVSRVMREAGFSSTQVKSNVEQAVSLDNPPPPPPPKLKEAPDLRQGFHTIHSAATTTTPERPEDVVEPRREDVMSVVECLLGRKKRSCVVVVGECLSTAEGVVRGMMETEVFKTVQFINLPLFSFAHLTKNEVEQKVGELRCVLNSCCVGRGAILYLGDLKWAAEYRTTCRDNTRSFYCPVEHVIMELGRMVCGSVDDHRQFSQSTTTRFWFMGVATYQTYMKCRVGYPSLESLWSLHPHTVPAGSLGLSLGHDHRNEETTNQHLPPWLQSLKETSDINPNSGVSCSSTSSTGEQSMEMDHQYYHKYDPKFKELNAENLKTLCCSLETKVPWQTEIIPEIVSIVLQCRSGMIRNKDTIGRARRRRRRRRKEETWMLFHGCDVEGKKKISTELANLVFGSPDSCFVSSCSSFTEAVSQNPHRVFFMDDVEQLDYRSLVGMKRAIERGSLSTASGHEEEEDDNHNRNDDYEDDNDQVHLEDAIVILSCENSDFSTKKPWWKNEVDNREDKNKIMINSCLKLDLNLVACCDDDDNNDDAGLIESVDRSFLFRIRD